MSLAPALLAILVDALEASPELAERLARVLAPKASTPDRIALGSVTDHGAPSARWCAARKIVRGPRGGRYVLAVDLEAALAGSTIARRERATEAPAEDARTAVFSLAARRKRKSA